MLNNKCSDNVIHLHGTSSILIVCLDYFIHVAFLERLKIAGIKWVSGFPDNVPKSLPTIVGLIILNDCETGLLLSICFRIIYRG